jgi:hypothetical protein
MLYRTITLASESIAQRSQKAAETSESWNPQIFETIKKEPVKVEEVVMPAAQEYPT